MKRIAVLILFAASLTIATAQQPPTAPAQTPAQAELQKRFELLQTQAQLLYEKLHGITEFQQYITIQQQLSDLQRQYAGAGSLPVQQPRPAVTPAAPPIPKK